jgi:acetyltransferase
MAEKQVEQYADVARAAVRTAKAGKPVVAFSHVSGGLDPTIKGILDRENVPFLQGTRESLLAINHLVQYGAFLRGHKWKKGGINAPPPNLNEMVQRLRGPRRVVGDKEAKEILKAFGIPVAKEILVQTVEEALDALKGFSCPVVLKGQSAEIPHKTEAGLVQLNIRSPEELRPAFERVVENACRFKSGVHLEGVLVQEMMPTEAVEVILGISRDLSFGPAIVFGLGGIWVELLKDTTLRIPPVDPEEARGMVSEIRGRAVLEGFRGSEKADVESLVGAIVQIGQMAIHLRHVLVSLDLNPLMVLPGKGGIRVVDVVMEAGDL